MERKTGIAPKRKRAPSSLSGRGVRLLRKQEVCARIALSNSALYRRIALGEFTPIRLGPGCRAIRFEEAAVDAWLAARLAASKAEGTA